MFRRAIVVLALALWAVTAQSPCNATHPFDLSGTCYIRTNVLKENVPGCHQPNTIVTHQTMTVEQLVQTATTPTMGT